MENESKIRTSLKIVWLVAAGFMLIGAMDLAAYWFKCRHDHAEMHLGRCLFLSIPLVIGAAILVKSSALARWVDQYLEE